MEYFRESARGLIARAVEFARQSGAGQVELEHLLLVASPDALEKAGLSALTLEPPGSPPGPSLEFSPGVLRLFEQAYRAAGEGVEELHLLLCVDLRGPSGIRLRQLLTPEMEERLEAAGVDTKTLMSEIGGADLASARPEPAFWATECGRRLMDLVCAATRPGTALMATLSAHLMGRGAFKAAAARAGLTESGCIDILLELGGNPQLVERLLSMVNWVGLDEAARVAVAASWNLCRYTLVTPQNLLDGLLYADLLVQPGRGATAVLRRFDVVGFVHADIKQAAVPPQDDPPPVLLSEEVERGLAFALEQAKPASTQHLLYGLARVGMAGLRQVGITPSRILEQLG